MIDRSRTEKNVNTASSFIILTAAIHQRPDLAVVILTLDTLQYYVQLVGTLQVQQRLGISWENITCFWSALTYTNHQNLPIFNQFAFHFLRNLCFMPVLRRQHKKLDSI